MTSFALTSRSARADSKPRWPTNSERKARVRVQAGERWRCVRGLDVDRLCSEPAFAHRQPRAVAGRQARVHKRAAPVRRHAGSPVAGPHVGAADAARRCHRLALAADQPRVRDAADQGRHRRPTARADRCASVDRSPESRRAGLRLSGRSAPSTLYVDLSGEPLFKRGWRADKGEAPLKENLAAGLLALAGWTPDVPLLDPFCGSGTIVIEAATIAARRAPGLNRSFRLRAPGQLRTRRVAPPERPCPSGRRRRGAGADRRLRHLDPRHRAGRVPMPSSPALTPSWQTAGCAWMPAMPARSKLRPSTA